MNENLRILIVEDNPADADFIHEMLPQAGPLNFQVESVQRLSEALARLAGGGFDLVLLDLGLPDSQGLQTFYTLQKAAPDVPVVVLTGNDDQELAVAAMREGAQDFLVKGQISGRPLVRAVRFALARRKAEDALRHSELKFRLLVENIPQKIFVKGPDYRYLSMSGNLAREFHIRPEEVAGKTDYDFFPKELADKYREDDRRIMRLGKAEEFDEICLQDGHEVWVHIAKTPLRDESGKISGVLGIFWDISERKQAENNLRKSNRALRLISLCNQEMVRATDETALMQAVCRLAVEPGGYRMAWVGFAEQDEAKSVRPVAQAGLVDGYLDNVNITWADVENGRGPTGTAIRTGKPVYISNMLTEPAFAPWREAATRRGYASSIALPMMTEGRCFGALMIYAGQPDAFDTEEIELLSELAGDLAFGVAALRQRAERKQVEVALRDSEEKFSKVFHSSPVAISISTIAEGRYLDVNDEFLKMSGWSREEVIGHTALELNVWANPEDRAAVVLKLKQDDLVRNSEFDVCTKSGQVRRTLWSVERVTIGNEDCFLGTSLDITDRKRTEEAMARTAREWQSTFDATKDAIWILDKDNRILRTNKTAEKYFSRPCCDMLGKPCWEIAHGTTEPVPNCPFVRAYKTGQREMSELQHGDCWLETTVDPIKDADGRFAGAVHIVSDITGRKRVEQQMKEALDFNRAIIADAAVGITAFKASGPCVLANEAAAKILGGTVSRLLESDFRQITSWRVSGMLQVAEKVLATKDSQQCEETFTSTYGREVSLVSHISHFIQNGEPHLLHFFTDVTERKKLEAQFLRAQRMESIGTLAGGIAHDLNNVLAPLLISVQLLGDKVTDTDGRRILAMLEANVHRGTDLVRQVLAFGRGIQGERVLVQIGHIAREIKGIVQETFPKSVQFQMDIAPDLWKVTGDATQIEQVLLNLSVNARDAMPDGGRLSLKMENKSLDQIYADANLESKPGRYVVISMTDTGMGMTRDVQDRIFEPFFTTKEHGKGTGLGLSTTRAIVKSHGGFIHCYSEPGKGSTFKVYLPAGVASDVQAAPGKTTGQLPRGHNELVLIVDDEEPIRRVAKQVLESFGYRTLSAVNGVAALKIYKAHQDEIALVFTDMAMPVMDGPATIAALKAINPRIKIIATSGLDSGSRPGAAIRPFIAKPYTADGLLKAIQSTLRGEPAGASEKKKTKEKGG